MQLDCLCTGISRCALLFSRVIALSKTGQKLFESVPLPGIQAGTPVTSANGRYILINTGYFTILDANQNQGPDTPLEVWYQSTPTNSTNPFSPIGYFHNPSEGYYDGGQANTNDMFVWGYDTATDATTAGAGQMFGFQMPVSGGMAAQEFELGGARAFQSGTAPILANSGRSMYWSVTRSQQICWDGSATLVQNRFSRGTTASIGFARGSPVYIGARASPTINSKNWNPTIYGPGAANEVWAMNRDYSVSTSITTSSIVSSRVVVSPDDAFVYYATQDGTIARLDGTTLEALWEVGLEGSVEGDIALNKMGTMLYVGGSSGVIRAYQVAINTSPTITPTKDPDSTGAPTVSPSGTPTLSMKPTPVPTVSPSASPTNSPAPTGSDAPTHSPTTTTRPTFTPAPSVVPPPSDFPSLTPSSTPTKFPTMTPTMEEEETTSSATVACSNMMGMLLLAIVLMV
jgi:hypothetical protein